MRKRKTGSELESQGKFGTSGRGFFVRTNDEIDVTYAEVVEKTSSFVKALQWKETQYKGAL